MRLGVELLRVEWNLKCKMKLRALRGSDVEFRLKTIRWLQVLVVFFRCLGGVFEWCLYCSCQCHFNVEVLRIIVEVSRVIVEVLLVIGWVYISFECVKRLLSSRCCPLLLFKECDQSWSTQRRVT